MGSNKISIAELKKSKVYPFCIGKKNIYYVKESGQGDKYEAEQLSTRFEIVSVVMDAETKYIYYDVAFTNDFGVNTARISKAIFCKRRFHELLAYGIDYNAESVNLLLSYVRESVAIAPHITETTRLGWGVEEGGEAFFGYESEDDKIKYVGLSKLTERISCGTRDDYINNLNELIKDSVGCQLAVCISLSSVLFSYYGKALHTDTPIFHLYGDSSRGKTSALMLAASMWGNPDAGNKLLNTWHATENAIIASFGNNYGVTLCYDEAGTLSRSSYDALVYSINQGVDKCRHNSSATQPPHKQWRTVMLSSGENSLLEKCKKNSGLRVRCVEFLDLDITNSAEHSKRLKTFCLENYGVLGRMFVEAFAEDTEPEFELYNKIKNNLDKEINSLRGTDERLITIFAVVLEVANRLKSILAIDIKALKKLIVGYLKETSSNVTPLYERALDAIREWISNNTYRISHYYGDSHADDTDLATKIAGEYIIKEAEFKKLLFEAGFSDVNVVAKSLKNAGYLTAEGNGLKYRYKFGGQRVACYKIKL